MGITDGEGVGRRLPSRYVNVSPLQDFARSLVGGTVGRALLSIYRIRSSRSPTMHVQDFEGYVHQDLHLSSATPRPMSRPQAKLRTDRIGRNQSLLLHPRPNRRKHQRDQQCYSRPSSDCLFGQILFPTRIEHQRAGHETAKEIRNR